MRLATAFLFRAHFALACWHERRASALLAEIRLRRLAADNECLQTANISGAGRVLLASIVGMAIAGIWIGITWRAWQ